MIKKISFISLLLFSFNFSYGQTTIYTEGFSGQNGKGAFGPTPTTNLTGVNWDIDISLTTLDKPSDDWFMVRSERLEGRDLDTNAFWYSPVTDISGFTDVQFSLEASEIGNLEATDIFNTEYRINGGTWIVASTNGSLNFDFTSATVSQTGLAGNTIQIKVLMINNATDEGLRLDNILIEGTKPTTPTISVNPNFVSGMAYAQGETSIIEDSFTVQGFALTTDIILTSTANFEISTTSGTGFGPSISLTPAMGAVGLTTIYTRLISGLTVNNYTGSIAFTSTGAPSKSVNATGVVIIPIEDCSELMITEYHEPDGTGNANEKYIELYNPTNTAINLSNYRLAVYNGINLSASDYGDLSGTIDAYSTYLISRDDSTLCLSGTADLCLAGGIMNFNGNDAMALQTIGGANIDVVGLIGDNAFFGQNVVLRRNPDVLIPTMAYNASQWSSSSANDTSQLGSHISDCLCSITTTWSSGIWDNGTPNINMAAQVNDNFSTASNGGSFSACNLTINSGAVLNIDDNTFIEIQKNLIVNAGSAIMVQPQGAFVQIDDLGTVSGNGIITVEKQTAPMNQWYEYTYWSSPVSGVIIANGLAEAAVNRRFWFNAQNFLDATAETGNNNVQVEGQDGIDDNGDNWILTNGSDIMLTGVGYASTHDKTLFSISPQSPPYSFRYSFVGPFNNGVIDVPLYRNDSELNDYNLNFIGNPYPSAIDADLFLAVNTDIATDVVSTKSINGALFLWSQNTLPSGSANGNQVLNFSNDDYAIINASGQLAGGDGEIPNRFIPSGQGFFVVLSNTAPATLVSGDVFTINVVFNNSMRVKGLPDNSQFFRGSNSKIQSKGSANKLWVNLTSDIGIFNQILVAYINGATNNDDGLSYDATRTVSNGSAIYTTIEGSNKKFAIQGKDKNSLDTDEVIKLGFSTTINLATLYNLSIAKLQGNFLSANTVYLKDNLLDTIHNLTTSDYTFTSEVGEFNDRFEIVFKAGSLSTDAFLADANTVRIIELENNHVMFKASEALSIKTVTIFDLLGRQLYHLEGHNSEETLKLSNFNKAVYIAKIELLNGTVITKKAIKK